MCIPQIKLNKLVFRTNSLFSPDKYELSSVISYKELPDIQLEGSFESSTNVQCKFQNQMF